MPTGFFSALSDTSQTHGLLESGFKGCTSLQSVPIGFMSAMTGNVGVDLLKSCFEGCTGLTLIWSGFLDNTFDVNNPGVFDRMFYNCTSLTGTTPTTADGSKLWGRFIRTDIGIDCFYNCAQLTDYNSIPVQWK
jgi:hypothetical protein